MPSGTSVNDASSRSGTVSVTSRRLCCCQSAQPAHEECVVSSTSDGDLLAAQYHDHFSCDMILMSRKCMSTTGCMHATGRQLIIIFSKFFARSRESMYGLPVALLDSVHGTRQLRTPSANDMPFCWQRQIKPSPRNLHQRQYPVGCAICWVNHMQ